MEEFSFAYERINGTTWFYLSSLLMLALFFKFNRFWSVRNFDLILIILLAPGLLMVEGGRRWVSEFESQQAILAQEEADDSDTQRLNADPSDLETPSTSELIPAPKRPPSPTTANGQAPLVNDSTSPNPTDTDPTQETATRQPPVPDTLGHRWQRWGYYWLFSVGAIFLIRLLIDPSLVRRPLLEPNLTIGGMIFFAASLMVFSFANIVTSDPSPEDLLEAENAIRMIQREAANDGESEQLRRRGPGYMLFFLLPVIQSSGDAILHTDVKRVENIQHYIIAAKTLAIASQLLVVLGLVLFCHYNYHNFAAGVAIATIYLVMPYSAFYTGYVAHVLPGALMLWALVGFRRPLLAGLLIGFATGMSYYPIFLLPLWASFYWKRGVRRFITGVLIAVAICVAGLMFTSVDSQAFVEQIRKMFGFWSPIMDNLEGIWALGWNHWWRLPLLVGFVLFCVSFVAWPNEKNIGTLASFSAAIMVAVQFWHGFGGGLYMAWYVPMALLVFFRPNLNGRVAIAELTEKKRPHKETAKDLLPAA